jgi:uncharacterized membrane protein
MNITTAEHDTATTTHANPAKAQGKLANGITWALQGLLSLLYLFAGAMKFIMPAEQMTKGSPLPLSFFYFIGVCEILGGLGLVLPGALKIRRGLTPIAAVGLTIIMVGAVAITFNMDPKMALTPFIAGALLVFVAYRRWNWLAD